ncbi:MAG: O-antigen ligase family protein [Gammaproteobacteria bacterium]|nr:O-antigen ligase family protein [Gammaproteobacteria bacterium]
MSPTLILFLAAYGLSLVAAFFRNPVFGLYAYLAVFYLHPPARWWGVVFPEMRWALLAAFVTLVSMWRMQPAPGRAAWLESPGAKLLVLFILWFLVQTPWALDQAQHAEAATLFIKYGVLFFLIYKLVPDMPTLERLAAVHVLGCFYLGWLAFEAPASGRLDGVGGPGIDEANALGLQLVTGMIFAVPLLLSASKVMKGIAVISLPLLVNGLFQTESRGALLAAIAGGMGMFYLGTRQVRGLLVAAALLGLPVAIVLAPPNFLERVTGTFSAVTRPDSGNLDASASGRLDLIPAQFRMFMHHPFGTGHRGTAVLSPDYLDEANLAFDESVGHRVDRASHNTLMTVLVEQGAVGMVLFLGILWWAARTLRRLQRTSTGDTPPGLGNFRVAVGGTLLAILAAGMFVDYLKSEIFYWCLALVAVLDDLARRLAVEVPAAGETAPAGHKELAGRQAPRVPPLMSGGRPGRKRSLDSR